MLTKILEKFSVLSEHQEISSSGKHKLRLCGLSDPERGLREAYRSFNGEDGLLRAINVTKASTSSMLESTVEPSFKSFEQSVLMIRDDRKLTKRFKKHKLRPDPSVDQSIFSNQFGEYDFKHNFISKEGSERSLSTIYISGDAIDETIDSIGECDFKKLEKSLGALFVYGNHDYTMHRYGVAIRDQIGFNRFIEEHLAEEHLPFASKEEYMSARLHADMVSESAEHGMKIYESIEKQASIALEQIQKIEDINLQNYWLKVLKYPLFSLVNPNVEEGINTTGGAVMSIIKESFPNLDLKPTRWSDAVHKSQTTISLGRYNITQLIDTRILRKMIVEGLHTNNKNTINDLAVIIGEKAGYQGTIESMNDIRRITRARTFNLADESSDDEIDEIKEHQELLRALDGFLSDSIRYQDPYNTLSKMKKFQEKGYDFSKYDTIDWRKHTHAYDHKKYLRSLDKYTEADSIHAIVDDGIWIEKTLIEIEERGGKIDGVTSKDWHEKNRRNILRILREQEQLHFGGEFQDEYYDFGFLVWHMQEKHKEKFVEKYDLEEFNLYQCTSRIRETIFLIDLSIYGESGHLAEMRYLYDQCNKSESSEIGVGKIKDLIGLYFEEVNELNLRRLEENCQKELSPSEIKLIQIILISYHQQGTDITYFSQYIDISFLDSLDQQEAA